MVEIHGTGEGKAWLEDAEGHAERRCTVECGITGSSKRLTLNTLGEGDSCQLRSGDEEEGLVIRDAGKDR